MAYLDLSMNSLILSTSKLMFPSVRQLLCTAGSQSHRAFFFFFFGKPNDELPTTVLKLPPATGVDISHRETGTAKPNLRLKG